MKMKKIMALVLAGTMAFSMAAYGSGASAEEAADGITGTIVYGSHRTDIDDLLYKVIEGFEAKYPGTEVELETISDWQTTIPIRLASNEMPDVFSTESYLISDPSLMSVYYLPLEGEYDLDEDEIYFSKKFEYEGVKYGYSMYANSYGLLYNKEVLANAGVEEFPRTREEFISALEKIKAIDVTPLGTQFIDVWPLENFMMISTALAGDAWYETWMDREDPFADEGLCALLDWYRELIDLGLTDELTTSDFESVLSNVVGGSTAMMIVGDWAIGSAVGMGMDIDNIGFMPLPVGDTAEESISAVASDIGVAVNANTENPETAKAFLKYLLEFGPELTGASPALKNAQSQYECMNEFKDLEKVMGRFDPISAELQDLMNEIEFSQGVYVQNYLTSDDPQTVIDEYNAKWAELLKTVQ